ncbi:DUF445 domain-containing protein [Danxiaibacter flavus]|uniref:DUF445 domain-containing protein n=1 Tax=Danxiaibacter flavus TaxID=3049108 RepID=A0ABV3Z8P4_9BACT|nr:DUF445 domain-containing protein [Chitinophagaceae bacterium DXS]
MMLWLLSVPVAGALLGWLIAGIAAKYLFHPLKPQKNTGQTTPGIISRTQQQLAREAGTFAAGLFSSSELEKKLADPETLQKIMPFIDEHVDHFLRVKLGEAIPMIGMFIGDKTIAQLKALFMEELQTLFPEVMKNYARELQQDFNPAEIVSKKIASMPPEKLASAFLPILTEKIRSIRLMGTIIGFTIGLVQLLLMLVAYNFR